ncbi:MAG: hydrogenase maturation nickel metallochaperone HypA [Solirubrobacterales bacterium]
MHELSLATAVVETVVKHAEGRPVRSVQMRIGTLRQVVPESLDFYFGICSRDSVCEDAVLEQEIIQAKLRCESCGEEWELEEPDFRCRSCAQTSVEVVAGTEFEVDSIEVTEENATDREEAGCIAPR